MKEREGIEQEAIRKKEPKASLKDGVHSTTYSIARCNDLLAYQFHKE
jgi:hypothetical protein